MRIFLLITKIYLDVCDEVIVSVFEHIINRHNVSNRLENITLALGNINEGLIGESYRLCDSSHNRFCTYNEVVNFLRLLVIKVTEPLQHIEKA